MFHENVTVPIYIFCIMYGYFPSSIVLICICIPFIFLCRLLYFPSKYRVHIMLLVESIHPECNRFCFGIKLCLGKILYFSIDFKIEINYS